MSLLREESLAKKLITKWSLVYFFSFLVAPAWYLARVIASNSMSVEHVWIFYSILGFVGLLAIYNDLGLTEALQYFLPKYWIEKKYNAYKTIRWLTILMQFVSWLLIWWGLWLGSDWLAVHYFGDSNSTELLKLFSLYFVAINIFQALSSTYIAFQNVLYDKVTDAIRLYTMVIVSGLFWLNQSFDLIHFWYAWLWGLLVALMISVFLFLTTYAHTLKLGTITIDRIVLKKQLSYAFWVFLWLNVGTVLWQVDQQIIILFLGAKSAGYYSNYLSLINIVGVILWPLFYLLFPITTELITKNNHDKVQLMLSILYKYFSLWAIALSWFLVALWPQIASVLYGKNFLYAGQLLSYSASFSILTVLFSINFWVLAGMGKAKKRVGILLTALFINVVLNLFFITQLHRGIAGVLVATIVGWFVIFVLSAQVIFREYPIKYDWGFVGGNTIAICWLAGILFLLRTHLTNIFVAHDQIVSMIILAIVWLLYVCIIGAINYKSIALLWQEVRSLWFMKK